MSERLNQEHESSSGLTTRRSPSSRGAGASHVEERRTIAIPLGEVAEHPEAVVEIAKLDPAWRGGGGLSVEPFADAAPTNVADAAEATALVALVRSRLSFFALLEDPPRSPRWTQVWAVPSFVPATNRGAPATPSGASQGELTFAAGVCRLS